MLSMECGGIGFFFFKQKTAYEMCGRDWSSDVCSSDLVYSFRFINSVVSCVPFGGLVFAQIYMLCFTHQQLLMISDGSSICQTGRG